MLKVRCDGQCRFWNPSTTQAPGYSSRPFKLVTPLREENVIIIFLGGVVWRNPKINCLILAILSWPRSDLRIVNIPKERIASCRGFKVEGGEAFTKYLVRGLPLPKIGSAKYFSRCCKLERLLTFFRNRIFQKLFDTDSPSEDFMYFWYGLSLYNSRKPWSGYWSTKKCDHWRTWERKRKECILLCMVCDIKIR